MGNLKARLKSLSTAPREATVLHGGETWTMRGSPDVAHYVATMMMPEAERAQLAAHYALVLRTRGVEKTFDASSVWQIRLVARTLVQDGERVDEVDVAHLAATDAPLFLKLFGGAMDVVGMADDDPVEAAVLGNSPAPDPAESSSSGS